MPGIELMKRLTCLFTLAVLAPLLPCRAAEDKFALSTNELPCNIEVRDEYRPGVPLAHRVYVQAGTNEYAFALTSGYRVENLSNVRISLTTEDYTRFISFRILLPVQADTGSTAREPYRHFVLRNKEPSQLLAENQAAADAMPGHSFDVRWAGPGGLGRISRIVFIPRPEGVIQLRADAPESEFKSLRTDLNALLATFVARRDGKLEVSPLVGNF